MKKFKINRNLIDIIILIIVTLFLCIPLFYSKLDVYKDDGIQHIARAYGTLNSIKEDGLFPNIISSFANGYGYSWNLFYGPLSTYGIIIFNLIVNNYIVAYKILAFVCMFLSGFFMYKYVKNMTKINDIGLLSGILYMSFPYHLTDLYTRNALGEFVSFVFIPIVFLGLYNIFYEEKRNGNYYLTFGAVGLILTHNLSTVIVAIISLFYAILNFDKIAYNKKMLKSLALSLIFILLISSFYWIPLVETKLMANYEVYEEGMMSTSIQTAEHGLKLKQLFITPDDGSFVFELGLHIIIMLAFSIIALRVIDKPLKEQYYFFFIVAILSLWATTKYFPWKWLPESFSIIQFPWRIEMISAFCISIICAINMYIVVIKFNLKDVIVLSAISLFCITSIFITNITGNLGIEKIENLTIGNFSGKEIEVVTGCGKGEYLPNNLYKDKFYLATREDTICVLEDGENVLGKAIIENAKKDGTNYTAKIQTLDSEYTIFELPYTYYPGYKIRFDGIEINNFETENGLLGFALGKNDSGILNVSYTGTKAMNISVSISIISLIIFVLINIKESKNLKNEVKQDIIADISKKEMEEKNV